MSSVAFGERRRGQVPLNFDEGGFNVRRFATRALACGERVRYPTIFPKSLIRYLMTGDGIVANRGLIEMLESLFALADYRPSLSTLTFEGGDLHCDYCTEVAAHAPEDCLEGKSLGFYVKRRESCGSPEL